MLQQQRQGNVGAGNSLWPRAAGGVRVDGMFDNRMRFGNGFGDETTFSVPAEKCGLVIGKGMCQCEWLTCSLLVKRTNNRSRSKISSTVWL